MKKKIYIFIVFSFLKLSSFGQFASYQIKEHYDAIINSIVNQNTFEHLIPDNCNGDFLGDQVSYALSSLLKMYYTTGDKAYLIHFVSWSYKIQMVRNDISNSSNHPGWAWIYSSDGCCNSQGCTKGAMYQDGLIIMSMAEFVYLINNSQLKYLPLPSALSLGLNHNNLFPPTSIASTYGDYAQWLGLKVENTLDYYFWGGYWINNGAFKQYPNDTHPAPINFQAGFAVALYYMGINDPNYFYQNAVNTFDNLYHGSTSSPPPPPSSFPCPFFCPYPVFYDYLQNDTYVWTHCTWSAGTCEYWEDISHGIQDLFLPRILYNSPYSYNFTQTDMIKLHNTFTKNVYAGSGNFYSSVAHDNNVYPGSGSHHYNVLNAYKMRALGWMPFYKFDTLANTLKIYEDIVMPFYISQIYSNQTPIVAGLDYLGLSEVVAAQWDKECVNLTLYNRDVIYDQDFIVKNKLIIAPQDNDVFYLMPSDPFAEPKRFVDSGRIDRFVVEPGITVNFIAGESITFKPGTHIKLGSSAHAYIQPNPCTDGMKLANFNNIIAPKSNSFTNVAILDAPKVSYTVAPNPFNEVTFIKFTISKKSIITLKIVDQFGRIVFSGLNYFQIEPGDYSIPFEGYNLEPGIYFCTLEVNGTALKTEKILLIK